MFAWIADNPAAFAVCAALFCAVAASLAVVIRNKIKKKSSCGCSCKACAMYATCHKK